MACLAINLAEQNQIHMKAASLLLLGSIVKVEGRAKANERKFFKCVKDKSCNSESCYRGCMKDYDPSPEEFQATSQCAGKCMTTYGKDTPECTECRKECVIRIINGGESYPLEEDEIAASVEGGGSGSFYVIKPIKMLLGLII